MSRLEQIFDLMGKTGLAFLATGVVATRFVYVVDGGERVVIFDRLRGLQPNVYGEGMHFMIPGLHVPRRFTIRTRPYSVQSITGTRDLQQVQITLRILFRPQAEKLSKILNNLGPDYDERVLPSVGSEVLKSIVAQYDAGQLITMREKVSQDIKEQLQRRSTEFDLEFDDVSITDLRFSNEFSASIEQKQVAEQMALKAQFEVQMQEYDTQARIIKSDADAEASKMISDAIQKHGQGLVVLRKIEAALYIAEQLRANPNVNFIQANNTMNML